MLSTSTLLPESVGSLVIRWVASIPSPPGMRISMSTTSGFVSRVRATASLPVSACPAVTRSGAPSTMMLRLCRNSGWSSAMRTPIGQAGGQRPTVPRGCGVQRAVQRGDAFAQPIETVPGPGFCPPAGPRPVVPNVHHELVLLLVHLDPRPGGARVPTGVGQGFTDNGADSQLHAGRDLPQLCDIEVHGQPGVVRSLHDGGKIFECFGRAERRTGCAQDGQHAAQLGRGPPAGLLDIDERASAFRLTVRTGHSAGC